MGTPRAIVIVVVLIVIRIVLILDAASNFVDPNNRGALTFVAEASFRSLTIQVPQFFAILVRWARVTGGRLFILAIIGRSSLSHRKQ